MDFAGSSLCRRGAAGFDFTEDHPSYPQHLGAALVQTLTPGCSMVWNNSLHEELRRALPVNQVMMHDAWVGLVATAIGRVVESGEVGVYYRIHETNSVGLEGPIMRRGFNVLRRLSSNGPTSRPKHRNSCATLVQSCLHRHESWLRAVSGWNRGRLLKLWMQRRIWRRGIRENMLPSGAPSTTRMT